jgi:hypothetical protein
MLKQFTLLFLLFVSTTLSTGCGGGVADVSGTVSYNGNPVKSGTVTVRASDGTVYSGTIENGNYVVVGIPSGEVKFTVVSPEYAAENQLPPRLLKALGETFNPKLATPVNRPMAGSRSPRNLRTRTNPESQRH